MVKNDGKRDGELTHFLFYFFIFLAISSARKILIYVLTSNYVYKLSSPAQKCLNLAQDQTGSQLAVAPLSACAEILTTKCWLLIALLQH